MLKIYIIRMLFLLALLSFSSCAIDFNHLKFYRNLNEEKQKQYELTPPDTIHRPAGGIYSINSREFLSAVAKDTTRYKLLVFFTWWCSSGEAFLPPFLNDLKKTDKQLLTFFISPDDWVYKYDYLRYARNIGLDSTVYLLDVYAYGEKRNPHYRMHKFITEICTDCEEIGGFPSLLLFNKENELVFKNTGAVPFDTIAARMKENP